MLPVNITVLAQAVHAAWRDTMIAQNRDVAPERMQWETLDERDRQIDRAIANAVCILIADALNRVR